MKIRVSEEVQNALNNHQPVVALETTIVSHGMPYPRNVETALLAEKVIRDEGAVPATIGIINGVAVIGMSPEEIEEFGKRKGIVKVSRRDLPVVYARKLWGATTVAGTMILAAQAGIEIFVTGGIGGVHRGVEKSMDISADLIELSKTNVTVVCAGAKAILDIPRTLEYLETMGVPVLGYQTEEMPAFYTRTSGEKVDYRMDSPKEVAEVIKEKRDNNLQGGVLLVNPIPKEYEEDKAKVDLAIEQALKEAEEQNIKGKESTPFLLRRVTELTQGESLESNIRLVLNNAKVGAQIAKELSKL